VRAAIRFLEDSNELFFICYPSLHVVVYPLLLAVELNHCDQADEQNGPKDDSGAVAALPGNEGGAVEQIHQALYAGDGGVGFFHHHVDQVIDLDRGHQAHNHNNKQRGGHHGQRDGKELPHRSGAVDAVGLIESFRDILETGQQEDGVVTDVAPDGHNSAGDHNKPGVGDPADMTAENLVENAVFAVEDEAPHHSNGGGSAHQRQEEDGAEAAFEFNLGVEEHSDQQGEEQTHRDCQNTEQYGVPGGSPELGVLEHIYVVLKSDERVAPEALMLTEAGIDGLGEGPQVQYNQSDHGGGHHLKNRRTAAGT